MNRVVDLLPRAIAAVAGLATALWGIDLSWEFAKSNEHAGIVAGLGMLLLVTPLLTLATAAVVFWTYSLLLAPLHWAVDALQSRRRHG